MRICAALIVGNEESVICRCLRGLRSSITQAAIVSSGDDETMAIASDHLDGWAIPFRVEHRAWTDDFAAARNASIDLATTLGADVLCTIDADDVLHGKPVITGNARIMIHDGKLRYTRVFSWLASLGARYELPIHETLSVGRDFPLLEGCWIERRHEGHRSRDPKTFEKDAEILARYVAEHPNDARATFYLAQSLRDARRFSAAEDFFEQCAAITSSDEERYIARLEAARCLERSLKGNVRAAAFMVLDKYQAAYALRPQRAEALYEILRFSRQVDAVDNLRRLTPVWLQMKPPPGDSLFVDHSCYLEGLFA